MRVYLCVSVSVCVCVSVSVPYLTLSCLTQVVEFACGIAPMTMGETIENVSRGMVGG